MTLLKLLSEELGLNEVCSFHAWDLGNKHKMKGAHWSSLFKQVINVIEVAKRSTDSRRFSPVQEATGP